MNSVMKRLAWKVLFAVVLVVSAAGAATASEWVVTKLRGSMFALERGAWQPLQRGAVVSDEQRVRTGADSRAQLKRGNETVDLMPQTEISIADGEGQGQTYVRLRSGVVAIEADRRQVQHFAVQTDLLAAVVKGTRFVVGSNGRSAEVRVIRGEVEVRDLPNKLTVRVYPGQEASVSSSEELAVSGSGRLDQVLPFTGSPLAMEVSIPAGAREAAAIGGNSGRGAGNGASGNGGGNSIAALSGNDGQGNSGGNGNGNSGNGNSGGANGNSGNGNSGGGNSGGVNGNSDNGNSGGGNGNSGGGNSGNGNSDNGNSGGGNGNSGQGNGNNR